MVDMHEVYHKQGAKLTFFVHRLVSEANPPATVP